MKKKIILLLVVGLVSWRANGQQASDHYYVIVGGFSKLDNALRFTNQANDDGFNAQYAFREDRKLYYVYLFESVDRKKAFAFLEKIRKETSFKTGWIYKGNLGVESDEIAAVTLPATIEKIETAEPEPQVLRPVKEEVLPVIDAHTDTARVVAAVVAKKPEGTPFLFQLTTAEGASVAGEVHVIDSRKSSQYQVFTVSQVVYIPKPASGAVEVTTLAPGYREMKRLVNFDDIPGTVTSMGEGGEAVIAFPLSRVKVGDYIEFRNVRFFQNSALLQPESKAELDGLVALLNENRKYKIRVHGHCNGNNTRDIVSKGESTHFFATDPANLKERGSAKQLSQLRAELLRDYLVSQGIDPERIKTRGAGGKEYLYPTGSTLAARNDRVEIEITKGK